MKYVGSTQIFPTTIWGFDFDNQEVINTFVNILYNMAETQGEGRRGGQEAFYYTEGSWQSNNLLDIEIFQKFFAQIAPNIIDAMQTDTPDRPVNAIKFKEAWGNINPPRTQIKEHLHIGSDYSGVFYLQTSENCGNISFRDPRIHYEMLYQTPNFPVNAKTGRILIFPAWLRHEIDINMQNEDRVGIAFNFKVK